MLDYQVKETEQQAETLDERVIEIARVAKVVKGGRRFQFRVTLIIGDNHGSVGMGVGKANAVPDAMRKATEKAHKDLHRINLSGTTIPHLSIGKVGGSVIMLKPASQGTGVIAGGGVRAVLEAVGIHDILTKSLGSANVLNAVQATLQALGNLKSAQEEANRRGKPVEELLPYWERRKKHG